MTFAYMDALEKKYSSLWKRYSLAFASDRMLTTWKVLMKTLDPDPMEWTLGEEVKWGGEKLGWSSTLTRCERIEITVRKYQERIRRFSL